MAETRSGSGRLAFVLPFSSKRQSWSSVSSFMVHSLFLGFCTAKPAHEPLPRGEQRVCKAQAAFQEPKKQRRLRALSSRETASVFLGGSRLSRAEGGALSLHAAAAADKIIRRARTAHRPN